MPLKRACSKHSNVQLETKPFTFLRQIVIHTCYTGSLITLLQTKKLTNKTKKPTTWLALGNTPIRLPGLDHPEGPRITQKHGGCPIHQHNKINTHLDGQLQRENKYKSRLPRRGYSARETLPTRSIATA
ncbi:hypothetical protein L798_05381 [Zootermopsis nevadensis]|uniref:Uncharacterized protein n=1 Tax=Zootermopsis nevadensis TaxID=136037 RepID=A0A067RHR6_ZOONE|nr:hypothetical protein L798_05381 [Zootermopsis nevadensis]